METGPYRITYHGKVGREDIPRLDPAICEQIQSFIERRLTVAPDAFGMPLRRPLNGYRKLRVGDYRIIYRVEKETVRISGIMHRSVVYRRILARL